MATLVVAIAAAAVAAAAAAASTSDAPVLGPFVLEPVVDFALDVASSVPLARPTGLTRADALAWIQGIVGYFRPMQSSDGRIIDQYAQAEVQYSTPTYCFACATLVVNNLTAPVGGPPLLQSCVAAMNASITELANASCATSTCNFFMKPVMLAWSLMNSSPLAEQIPASLRATWAAHLATVNPWDAYHGFMTNNWGLVAVGGEYLRDKAGLNTNASWYDQELGRQISCGTSFTVNGQYEDHTGYAEVLNPMPYDLFPRGCYLSVMVQEGYNGTYAAFVQEATRRGALVSLLMQSPKGELPTGGRSSQHQWNEAAEVLQFEIWASRNMAQARRLRQLQDETGADQAAQTACAFKRAARLALESLRRWVNTTQGGGDVQIVKNWFDPALRFGYEDYSFQSQYNLLPASMVSASLLYADETIVECSAPADTGGFVFALPEYHKVIANAGGTYIEIETGADPNYDSTGLQRVHTSLTGHSPLLGPTAGPPWEAGAAAVGPIWEMRPGCDPDVPLVDSLANMTFEDVTGVDMLPTAQWNSSSLSFVVRYTILSRLLQIQEEYTVTQGGQVAITVTADRARPCVDGGLPFASFGVSFPALVFDGRTNYTLQINPATSSATISGGAGEGSGSTTFTVASPGDHAALTWDTDPRGDIPSRNGYVSVVRASFTPTEAAPSLQLVVQASEQPAI